MVLAVLGSRGRSFCGFGFGQLGLHGAGQSSGVPGSRDLGARGLM